jgi:hypothetical protein
MGVEAPEQQPDYQEVHETLVREFTDRYLQRSGLSAFAFSLPYDPDDPRCDYQRTTWPAQPNARFGIPVGKLILRKTHHLSGREFNRLEATEFADKAEDISEALYDYPVLLVNGHAPDLQAALTLVLSSMAIARHDASEGRGSFHENFKDMAAIAHAVGTRGFGPVTVGLHPRLPHVTLVRISQMVMHPHLSFPATERVRESSLPPSFTTTYNDLFKEEFLEAVRSEPTHPTGYHVLASTPPSGAPDAKGLDNEGREIRVTRLVSTGTIELIRNMGCGLLPVYAHFGRGKASASLELGRIISPDEVDETTIPEIMLLQAAHRRAAARTNGDTLVYYEGEAMVTAILREDTKEPIAKQT